MAGKRQAFVIQVVINRITASLIHRLGLPFQYVAPNGHNEPGALALKEMKERVAGIPRGVPGEVSVGGWHLAYVDAPALVSCFEVAVVKGWNDFVARREDPLILDCGANIGVTVLHYKRTYPKARIIAFEPDKEICKVLRKNLAANSATDVEVLEAAVWTAEGQYAFVAEGADGSRLAPADAAPDAVADGGLDKYLVNTVRLADYLAEGEVDFIKLDIEGAEFQVLVDCADLLRNVHSMAIEFHMMSGDARKLAAAFEALSDAGFNLSINSYGPWVDLTHLPERKPPGDLSFDQYILACAWRP